MKKLILWSLLLVISVATHAQEGFLISGTVIDSSGEPIPGASIVESGTTNGTISDFSGKYSFKLSSSEATITISFIGFATQVIPVAGKSQIDIVLQAELTDLDEVVVVG
jgi:hypothetical protein